MAKQKETLSNPKQYSLKQLGKETIYTFSYDPNVLESVPNPHPQRDYFIKFNCPEFTSLCPITGQPLLPYTLAI